MKIHLSGVSNSVIVRMNVQHNLPLFYSRSATKDSNNSF